MKLLSATAVHPPLLDMDTVSQMVDQVNCCLLVYLVDNDHIN